MRSSIDLKLRALITLDPIHKARVNATWTLVDRIYKLVEWTVIIALLAFLTRRAKGTPYQWVLALLGGVLIVGWIAAWTSWVFAYFATWFPDLDSRPWVSRSIISCLLALLGFSIIFTALKAFEVLVSAQINQLMK